MASVTREDDVTVIQFDERYDSLDDTRLDELEHLLLGEAGAAFPPKLVLDLGRTSYLGSRFIEVAVRAWKRLCHRQGRMAICGLQPFCREVIESASLHRIWELYATRADAVGALRA
jgi:anti-anti-sigma factor